MLKGNGELECPYSFYKEEETYFPHIYCNIDNEMCPLSRPCNKCEKYIPNGIYYYCDKYYNLRKSLIPKNSYYIKAAYPHEDGGILMTIDFNNIDMAKRFDGVELPQDYVYLKIIDGEYQYSFTPFE